MSNQSEIDQIRRDMDLQSFGVDIPMPSPDGPAIRGFMKAMTVDPAPIRRSPYHNIRLALTGKTAPFINMPLGTSRVYVERVR